MAILDQQEIPYEGRRHRTQARLRRGVFLLPAAMTSANLLCGYYAVIASLMGTPDDFNHAAKAIGIAIVFDSLDGRIARMTGTNTEFGVQFDSLADVVSFGIAPAVLAYAWGVRSVTNLAPDALHQLGRFGWLCCLAFLICCAWRLARFNVQGMAPGGLKSMYDGCDNSGRGGGRHSNKEFRTARSHSLNIESREPPGAADQERQAAEPAKAA